MNRKTIVRIGLFWLILAGACFLGAVWAPGEVSDQLTSTAGILLLAGGIIVFVGSYFGSESHD